MAVLKVSSHSSPSAAAGALANTIRDQGWAEIQVIGPKAVNQAVKAIAIARSYIASSGIDLITVPSFVEVEIEGQEKTAIKLEVRPRNPLAKFAPSTTKAVEAEAPEETVPLAAPEPEAEVEPAPEPEVTPEEPSEGTEEGEPPAAPF
jgi:stage V sporulation protein S